MHAHCEPHFLTNLYGIKPKLQNKACFTLTVLFTLGYVL